MTYQAASGAGAQNMRELLQQMGEAHLAAKALLDDPASSILDIDREVAGILRDDRFPTEHFGVPLAGSLIPWIDKDLGNGMSREEWKGGAETNKILGRGARTRFPSNRFACASARCAATRQALTIKLRRDVPLDEIERMLAAAHEWVRVVPNNRDASIRAPDAGCGHRASSKSRSAGCASWRWAANTSAHSPCGDQLLWGAAEPLRRMLRILLGSPLDRERHSTRSGRARRFRAPCRRYFRQLYAMRVGGRPRVSRRRPRGRHRIATPRVAAVCRHHMLWRGRWRVLQVAPRVSTPA